MENKHLITLEDFGKLARPVSKHIDEQDVNAFITECEDVIIIPAVGLKLYNEMLSEGMNEKTGVLLNGGDYKGKGNEMKRCYGIKKTLAYYVYAKMLQANGVMLTRTGAMEHNDSYAQRLERENKVKRYNEAMNVADKYLANCLEYIKNNINTNVTPIRGSRLKIHPIGD